MWSNIFLQVIEPLSLSPLNFKGIYIMENQTNQCVATKKMQPFPKQISVSLPHKHSTLFLLPSQSSSPLNIQIQTHWNSNKIQTLESRERKAHLQMATLQKFKLLAIHCGSSKSPTRSPRTSPIVQLRRRKTTLRMLLRRSPRRRGTALQRERPSEKKSGNLVRRHSLKDLFGSSPPGEEDIKIDVVVVQETHRSVNSGLDGSVYGTGSPGPGWTTGFRCRSLLSRKAWRPVLLAIHE